MMLDHSRLVHVEDGEKCGDSESMSKAEITVSVNVGEREKNPMVLPRFFGVSKKDGVTVSQDGENIGGVGLREGESGA